jgi:hypothetical protein
MRSLRFVPVLLLAMAVTAGPAVADQSQHTARLSLSVTPAGAAAGYPELQSGQVVNTHTSGPVNFAIEDYMVNGAKPDTAYAVVSLLFAGSCSGPLAFPFANGAVLMADAHGDAHGQAKLAPALVTEFGLHNTDWGIVWTLVAGGVTAYTTGCSQVHID